MDSLDFDIAVLQQRTDAELFGRVIFNHQQHVSFHCAHIVLS